MKKHLVISLLLFCFLTVTASAKGVNNLYQIVVDNGSTASDKEERAAYRKAFIDYVFRKVKPSNNDIVIIMSAFQAENLWYGTAKDFKSLRGDLRDVVTNFDHVQGKKSYDGLVSVDLAGVFSRIERNEKAQESVNKSVVFMFSPLLDTKTVMKGQKKADMLSLIEENAANLATVIKPANANNVKSRYREFLWVNPKIEDTIRSIFTGNTTEGKTEFTTQVYSVVRSRTILDSFVAK